jgi:hypothetical protein
MVPANRPGHSNNHGRVIGQRTRTGTAGEHSLATGRRSCVSRRPDQRHSGLKLGLELFPGWDLLLPGQYLIQVVI